MTLHAHRSQRTPPTPLAERPTAPSSRWLATICRVFFWAPACPRPELWFRHRRPSDAVGRVIT